MVHDFIDCIDSSIVPSSAFVEKKCAPEGKGIRGTGNQVFPEGKTVINLADYAKLGRNNLVTCSHVESRHFGVIVTGTVVTGAFA